MSLPHHRIDTTLDSRPTADFIRSPSRDDILAPLRFPLPDPIFGRAALMMGGSTLPWINFDALSEPQKRAYCASADEVISRVKDVCDLYKSGRLSAEAIQLGISPRWLDRLHAEGPRVVISEQQQPLVNLFAAIDEFGTPEGMEAALQTISDLRFRLASVLEQPVEAGFLASKYHGASFTGISFGGYLSIPEFTDNKASSLAIVKHNFFSKKERACYGDAAYGDLQMSVARLDGITSELEELSGQALHAAKTNAVAARRQLDYNRSFQESKGGLPDDKVERLAALRSRAGFYLDNLTAARNLLDDWSGAFGIFAETARATGKVPYIDFVSELNTRFVARVLPELKFSTFCNDVVDEMPATGVADWARFASKLCNAGIFEKGEAFCRVRTQDGERVRYLNGYLEEISSGDVTVTLKHRSSVRVVSLNHLAEESRSSVAEGNGPSLVPVAKIRYFVNLALSPSLILYDGVEYSPLRTVIDAMYKRGFLLNPRGPKLHAYSRLCEMRPNDAASPWDDLDEVHNALDYYHYLT